jgi:hypothetical protein
MFEHDPVAEVAIDCPYCGSQFSVLVDSSEGECDYIEDCAVCCQPIEFHLREEGGGELQLSVTRGDDAF